MALRTISLFSGYSGLDLGVRATCPSTVTSCYVENEAKAAELLVTRIADGAIDDAPIWSDIRSFDGRRFAGRVDGIVGGFPCTDLSVAGDREGLVEGNASGLWFEFARVIREVRPRWVFVENVSGILVPHADKEKPAWVLPAGLWFVLGELSSAGFDAEWITLRASDVGASQVRCRTFILARQRCEQRELQQRINGAKSSGGIGELGIPEHAERWPYSERGGCPEQGRDFKGQASGRPGDAEPVLECASVGGLGELRKSSALGGRLADRPDARSQRADSRSSEFNRRGNEVGSAECSRRSEAGFRCDEHTGEQPETGVRGLGRSIFPPGQGTWSRWITCVDGRAFRVAKDADAAAWCELIRIAPWLAPAIESGLRCVAHGTPLVVDEGRTDQLRMLGNGVVPLHAAVAFTVLAERLGMRELMLDFTPPEPAMEQTTLLEDAT